MLCSHGQRPVSCRLFGLENKLIKPHHHIVAASAELPTTRQRLFTRYFMAILTDLIVLSLFAEYWERVFLDSFTVSLLAAVLLQVLLQGTLALEHWVAGFFDEKEGVLWTGLRFFCAWLILFGSKFVMLGAIDRVFGDAVHFAGPFHGAGAFIAVVVAMLGAEELLTRLYVRLA